MNNEYLAEMHRLSEKAKSMERLGRDDEALSIYLELHAKYFPNTSDLYERPAILLEKKKRFDEAIKICEKAIKLIDEGKITGVRDNFIRRISRIKSRADYSPVVEAKEKSAFTKISLKGFFKKRTKAEKPDSTETNVPDHQPPRRDVKRASVQIEAKDNETKDNETKDNRTKEDFKERTRIIEQQTPEKNKKIEIEDVDLDITVKNQSLSPVKEESFDNTSGTAEKKELYSEHVDSANEKVDKPKWFDILLRLRKPRKEVIIGFAILILLIAGGTYLIQNKSESQFKIMLDISEIQSKEGLPGDPFENNKEDLPIITQTMIEQAEKAVNAMPGVKQGGIIIQKNVVGFAIMLNPGASKAQATDAAEVFIKTLSTAAAAEYPDLSAPGIVGYGSLFDYYTLLVVAGENFDSLLIKGSKNPKALGIYWRNE